MTSGKSEIELLQYSFKLFQKPHIVLEKQPYIVNPVFERGGALNAQAKGIAGVFAAVNFAIFENNGVNHTAAKYLNPARVLANRAALTVTENTGDIHLCRGFGEGKVRGTKPDFYILTKHFPGKIVERLFHVGKGNAFIYIKAFYLMKDAMCAGRDRLIPVNPSRADDPDGGLGVFHHPDLLRRGVRSQQDVRVFFNEKSVLHISCGVVFGNV